MKPAFMYGRTSGDDGRDKAGLPVQITAVDAFASAHAFEIQQRFLDDGVTGKLHMHSRPQGRLLIAALLADGVKHVLCYDAKRIGRTQPAFWSFIGMCRDNGITVLDANGTDLGGSVMGGVGGMLAEIDRDQTVARLAAGKAHWRALGKRVEGRIAYGEHPAIEYMGEKEIVARILRMHAEGIIPFRIARTLNSEGIRTRWGKEFHTRTILNIIERGKAHGKQGSTQEVQAIREV